MKETFHNSKSTYLLAFFALIAIFSGVFSFALFSAEKANSAMVYCPLTKTLQPVNPPKTISKNSLDVFCASVARKDRFAQEASKKIHSNFFSFNEKRFEKFVFDYFQNGKTVFGNLPKSPEFPHTNLAKNFNSAANIGNNKENQFIWKLQNENFSFVQNPRPPAFAPKSVFSNQIKRSLEGISRNINPRSPPVNLS